MVCQVWESNRTTQHILLNPNDLYGFRGFWTKLLHWGFRCDHYFSMSFTGQSFEPRLSNILPFGSSSSLPSRPPWWVFGRQHCSTTRSFPNIFHYLLFLSRRASQGRSQDFSVGTHSFPSHLFTPPPPKKKDQSHFRFTCLLFQIA